MKGTLRIALVGATALLAGTPTLADNTPEQNKVQYELQQKCSADAAEFLDRLKAGKVYGGTLGSWGIDGGKEYIDSRNHYSARFNKCFMLMRDITTWPGGAKKYDNATVWDVTDSQRIADFLITHGPLSGAGNARLCWALMPDILSQSAPPNELDPKNTCVEVGDDVVDTTTWPKWNALIAPYMQDKK